MPRIEGPGTHKRRSRHSQGWEQRPECQLSGGPSHDSNQAGDRQPTRATLVGVSPAGEDSVRLWSWAPESVVIDLGQFGRKAAPAIIAQMLRRRPGAELFVHRGALV
jgi:hypothetical protein